jgi:sialate O-acetylesterase
MKGALALILFILSQCVARADVSLPKLISDGMVLQRDARINVWGWATPGEKISIKINGKSYRAVAAASGTWKTSIGPFKAGGPFTMEITGNNAITLRDILIGDVWFCSGQSNMVITMERVKEKYPSEIDGANFQQIRNFLVPTYSDVKGTRKDLPGGKWVATTPETVLGFGAVAYFFAKAIYVRHHVPIGIINSSVGGTPIQAWISEEGLKQFSDISEQVHSYKDTAYVNDLLRDAANRPPPPKGDHDLGMESNVKWYDTAYVANGWNKFWLPGYWEDQGIKNLHGVVWFRKTIHLPAALAGKPAKLFMGRIIDADESYVNGVKVGNITYQYPPRRYIVPASLLKAGKNIIIVRVTNTGGKGGFVPDKPYNLVVGDEKIDLRGEWEYKVGQVFPNISAPAGPPAFSAQNSPTGLYNTMVAPVIPYTIRGFNWYQGETNAPHPENYGELLSALIADWRTKWNMGELPFSFVQLANFMEVQYSPMESQWAVLRNEQRKTLSVPRTAMVVAIDAGEWNDIHPLNKKDIGERLALTAEHLSYGDAQIAYSGPLYQSMEVNGNKASISFSSIGSGLVAKGGNDLHYFEVAGEDRKFVEANATIEGNRVVVWSEKINSLIYVRYAWADNPATANLYNKEGLPASPFEARVK